MTKKLVSLSGIIYLIFVIGHAVKVNSYQITATDEEFADFVLDEVIRQSRLQSREEKSLETRKSLPIKRSKQELEI